MLNRATMRVAETTEVSGRVTADSSKHELYAKKQSSLRRLTISGFCKVCSLVAATLILPALAYAQGNNPLAALQAQVTALQNQVNTQGGKITTLQGQVSSLQTSNTTLQGQVSSLQTSNTSLQSEVTALQNQLTTAQPVLALAPYVSVDPNPEDGVIGPNIKFTGANIHILSGSGATDDNLSQGGSLTGRGNLIIGYDENTFSQPTGYRGGSHNLVLGRQSVFTSACFAGIVTGFQNEISAEGACVTGGSVNTASGQFASVTGGNGNTASALESLVCGGEGNTASGVQSAVLGGDLDNASGDQSVVIGGGNNTASTANSIRPQPPFP
jgi:hypothetical protein